LRSRTRLVTSVSVLRGRRGVPRDVAPRELQSSDLETRMTGQQIYLAMIVGMFSAFAVGLIAASIWSRPDKN